MIVAKTGAVERITPFRVRAAMRRRLRMTSLLAADYGVVLLVLCGCAAAEIISYRVPSILFGAALLCSLLCAAAILSGKTKWLHDPSLTVAQLVAASGLHVAGMLLAPQISHFFMLSLIVPLVYASMHCTQRVFLAAWILLAGATAAAILRTSADHGMVSDAQIERMLFWAITVYTLGRLLPITAEMSRQHRRLERKNKELAHAAARLNELASRDELTGLWNRREFMRLLLEESRRAVRSQSSFCIAVIDIDHFKQVNNTYGHLIGDAVLHELAQLLESLRRATDSVARYGGEEFTLLLVNAKITTATVALERIRAQVMQHEWDVIAPGLQLTASAGIAAWRPGETLTQVLNRADAALYEAKHAGRNCVRVSQPVASISI